MNHQEVETVLTSFMCETDFGESLFTDDGAVVITEASGHCLLVQGSITTVVIIMFTDVSRVFYLPNILSSFLFTDPFWVPILDICLVF